MAFSPPDPGQPVMIEIDGQLLQIEYKLKALRAIEQQTGLSLFDSDAVIKALRSVSGMATFLLCGIQAVATNPPITAEWLDDRLTLPMYNDLMPAVTYAMFGPGAANPPKPEAVADLIAAIN